MTRKKHSAAPPTGDCMTESQIDEMAWSAHRDRCSTWSDGIEWWNTPEMSYRKGIDDGVRMGREQAYREILEGFAVGIGAGLGETCFREAMHRHVRAIENRANTRAWDATAAVPRPGDFQGHGTDVVDINTYRAMRSA